MSEATTGVVLHGRRQFDLHRREAADHQLYGGGADAALFAKLGLVPMEGEEPIRKDETCC